MTTARLYGQTIAKSDKTVLLEGSHYFPPQDVNLDALVESETRTQCAMKGSAHYFNVTAAEQTIDDAAWAYPNPDSEFEHISGYIAFWRGVEVAD